MSLTPPHDPITPPLAASGPSTPSTAPSSPALLEVGYVARAQGLRGEVIVELITNRTERLDPGSVLQTDGGALEVVSARPHGGPSRWLVAFAGVRSRDAAEALRGRTLRAEPFDADDGTLWVHEMVGSEVVELDGTSRGRVTDVQSNPASDLLVLDDGALVPLRFVTDQRPGWVQIDPPAGLFDL